MRNIVNLICNSCGNNWVAPAPRKAQVVRCPKCYSSELTADDPRIENAPLQ